jgi:hypothetical protein
VKAADYGALKARLQPFSGVKLSHAFLTTIVSREIDRAVRKAKREERERAKRAAAKVAVRRMRAAGRMLRP